MKKKKKKDQTKILVSQKSASELAALNCFYYEENTCHGKSMC